MKKIGLIVALLLVAGWLLLPYYAQRTAMRMNPITPGTPMETSGASRELHQSLLIVDLHADPLLWHRDLLRDNAWGHVDLPRLIAGNIAIQGFGVVTGSPAGQNFTANRDTRDRITLLSFAQHWPPYTWFSRTGRARYQARQIDRLIAAGAPLIKLETKTDLETLLTRRANGQTLIGALLGLEGAHALGDRADILPSLFDEGYRMLGLTHFFDNAFAGSAHGVNKGGLTPSGVELVALAERLGMLIDLAHASPKTIEQVSAISTRPLLVSHTGLNATCPGPRNLSDRQLRSIAASGGVIGIALFPGAICGDSLDHFFLAVAYAAQLIGEDHIALGSDFDGAVSTPIDAGQWIAVTQGLIDRGYSKTAIRKIMGGNVIRLLRQTLPEGTGDGHPQAES